ncbi:MAG: SIS domain-containing protein [Actinomycetota bacterium]|nr:SIS domain-containing protein [Actinomycetota bacterium]
MCGIVAVLSRPARRSAPSASDLVAGLETAAREVVASERPLPERLGVAVAEVNRVDQALRGPVGVTVLLDTEGLREQVADLAAQLDAQVTAVERDLDAAVLPADELEAVNRVLVALKDAVWAVARDRLRTASAVEHLSGGATTQPARQAYHDIQLTLSGLDRLEVRGRDSAGLHVLVSGHGLTEADLADELQRRGDPLFRSGAVRLADGVLSFVYKAAAEIGQLGDNTRALRDAIRGDALLRRAVTPPAADVAVLAHTRWASVGVISEANAHPLNQEQVGVHGEPYVVGVLNGDVDNHAELVAAEGLRLPGEVTTDAKVIPTLVAKRRAAGSPLVEAFRSSVAQFQGSVAITAEASEDPDRMLLACRGSGQGLFVGLAEDTFVVASEPYGLVEVADRYLRLDGETVRGGAGGAGQVVVLDRHKAGEPDGLERLAYDGTPLPLAAADLTATEVTTRDVDLGDEPHFLLKEIGQAPDSLRKTLRGKIVAEHGRLRVTLDEPPFPADLRRRLADGEVTRVVVIGQGTAAVAGGALVVALRRALRGSGLSAEAVIATEMSGYGLRDDMRDTLVVAVSQSGTTTDTNRTVDLLRARGATVLAIVNRRGSELVEKSDGVLYTADGRDVEMSVASTKAFYSQVAAGVMLALAVAEATGRLDAVWAHDVLTGLRALPDAMSTVIGKRKQIREIAARQAPSRRHWATVGNGPNLVTARELRIKLSELCYRSISVDSTEDKKHIDLSAEPMILVCAAGLPESVGRDVGKEVAIYRAHKAAPIVIATEGSHWFAGAEDVIEVPAVHPDLDFVLATVAGHLFGYEAALAIDAQARLLRAARDAVTAAVTGQQGVPSGAARSGAVVDAVSELRGHLRAPAEAVLRELTSGAFDGHLGAATGIQVASLLRYALSERGLEQYAQETERPEVLSALVDDLLTALSHGIDELTRPVDAIRHQAKTVTVGTSRSEVDLYDGRLAREVLGAGAPREDLSYRTARTLFALEPAVAAVTGWTRYEVLGDPGSESAELRLLGKGGVAEGLRSRTEDDPRLVGTKHRAAYEREVTLAQGHDGRTVLLVPETSGGRATGLTLLHVELADRLSPAQARAVLEGYRHRYTAVVDAVTETRARFDDAPLGEIATLDLLTAPVVLLARHWR